MAPYNLGVMYHHGIGVKEDGVKAIQYYNESLKRGYNQAYLGLGLLYQHGGEEREERQSQGC